MVTLTLSFRLTTIPFCLDYDTRSARRAREDVLLPHLILNAPQDVELQLRKGWNQHKEFFGERPEVFGLRNSRFLQKCLGCIWFGHCMAVTTNVFLQKLLVCHISQAGRDVPEQAALLYRPYKLSLSNGKEMIIVFRDKCCQTLLGLNMLSVSSWCCKWFHVQAGSYLCEGETLRWWLLGYGCLRRRELLGVLRKWRLWFPFKALFCA